MAPRWDWIERNRGAVRRHLRGRFDPLTADEALDHAQDEVEERASEYQTEKHFVNAWKQRGRQRAIDLLRRRSRPPRLPVGKTAEAWRVQVRLIVEELSPLYRQIILRKYFEGEVDQEIGQALWPDQSAANQVTRAHRTRRRAEAELRRRLLAGGMDTRTLDFHFGPLGRLRRSRGRSADTGGT